MQSRRVDPPLPREQCQHGAIQLDSASRRKVERTADAAFGERRNRGGRSRLEVRPMAGEQFGYDHPRQRREWKAAAARADRRQQPPRAVRHQQQQRAPRRLFEDLQQRIRRVAVHLVGAVDNHDAPAALGRGQPQKRADLARIVDDDLGA